MKTFPHAPAAGFPSPTGGEEPRNGFMAPMRVRSLEVEAFHKPEGRAGCPHPAAGHAGHIGRPRRGEDTAPYPPWAVQGFKARKIFLEKSHLDPLPFRRGEGTCRQREGIHASQPTC